MQLEVDWTETRRSSISPAHYEATYNGYTLRIGNEYAHEWGAYWNIYKDDKHVAEGCGFADGPRGNFQEMCAMYPKDLELAKQQITEAIQKLIGKTHS